MGKKHITRGLLLDWLGFSGANRFETGVDGSDACQGNSSCGILGGSSEEEEGKHYRLAAMAFAYTICQSKSTARHRSPLVALVEEHQRHLDSTSCESNDLADLEDKCLVTSLVKLPPIQPSHKENDVDYQPAAG